MAYFSGLKGHFWFLLSHLDTLLNPSHTHCTPLCKPYCFGLKMEWGMDFEGTTGVCEHIYCYSSKVVRKKERVIYEFKVTFLDLFQFSMTLGKAVI